MPANIQFHKLLEGKVHLVSNPVHSGDALWGKIIGNTQKPSPLADLPLSYTQENPIYQEIHDMAVSVKSLNGLAAIKHADIDQAVYDWLHYSGFQVKLTATAFEFLHPDFPPGKQLIVSVPVKMSQLHQLQQGTMSAEELANLQVELEAAIGNLQDYQPQPAKTGPQSAMAMLPKVGDKPDLYIHSTWPVFAPEKMKTAVPVALAEASHLYQPVKGTSANSRYFMIAANKSVRIAARWRPSHSSLSIRVEGDHLHTIIGNLSEAGLEMKANYASLHLSCPSETVARKAIGAILMGMGVTLETPLPNLAVIAEK